MEIYPDVIFLENFLMDYILLLLTGKVLHRQRHPWGILVAAMAGSSYTVIYYIVLAEASGYAGGNLLRGMSLANFLLLVLMVKAAFHPIRGKELFVCSATCLGLSFVTGGVLHWLERMVPFVRAHSTHLSMLMGSFLFGYLFLKKLYAVIRERYFSETCHLPVSITIGEKKINCTGLMDSGNSLYEPITGKPVVIVEEQMLREHEILQRERGFFAIPYHAIGTEKGMMKGVLADELEIPGEQEEKKWEKVMLGIYEGKISRTGDYQVILHPKL
nr:sigma-E processing peptidase SpoIIGA [Lachnospiraceae bacterium]